MHPPRTSVKPHTQTPTLPMAPLGEHPLLHGDPILLQPSAVPGSAMSCLPALGCSKTLLPQLLRYKGKKTTQPNNNQPYLLKR